VSKGNLSKDELLAALAIPPHLTARDKDQSLHLHYLKYKACLQAQQTLDMRCAEGTWPGKKPTSTEIIELFTSKSMWHSHLKCAFSTINNYPLMLKWLDGGEGSPSDLDVWGWNKHLTAFQIFLSFLMTTKEGR
jgi:hypothetical protein